MLGRGAFSALVNGLDSLAPMRTVQLCALAGLATTLGTQAAWAQHRSQPNLIVILADDLGYGDLGSHGQQRIATPALDRFAAEGLRLTQFYSGGPTCAPSRDSLLTGLRTGNRDAIHHSLRQSDRTIADELRHAGYATAAVGKWGLGEVGDEGHPNRQGFDYFYGYLSARHAHNFWPDHLFENDQRVPLDNEVVYHEELRGEYATKRVDYAPTLLLAKAKDFVRRHESRPFFLFFAPNLVHANSELEAGAGDGVLVARYVDKPWPEGQKGYASMVTLLDTQVAELMQLLQDLELDRDTLILFTSDNGPHKEGGSDPAFFASTAGMRGEKSTLYEGGIRVPMLARWPDRIRAGSVSHALFGAWDVLPTLLDAAGASASEHTDGVSFLPANAAPEELPRGHDHLYFEQHHWHSIQAVRTARWKAILTRKLWSNTELYDLTEDPQESRDVAGDHPEVVAELEAIMKREHLDWAHHPLGMDWKNATRTYLGWLRRETWFQLSALGLAITIAVFAVRRRLSARA
jgi:arylsulfatase A-like enzyme